VFNVVCSQELMQSKAEAEAPAAVEEWKTKLYDIMSHFADAQGIPRRCCVCVRASQPLLIAVLLCRLDHDDHVHLIYRCNCPANCEPQNIVVPITVEMLLEVYPESRLHIHEKQPCTKPTQDPVIDALPVHVCSGLESGSCSICCTGFEQGEEAITLPCGHLYHKACVIPWLKRASTCPECRHELNL